MKNDDRLRAAIDALHSFREDQFVPPPEDAAPDALGELHRAVRDLGRHLQEEFTIDRRLDAIIDRINFGIRFEEVLSTVYDSFHDAIPYDRIGCALIVEDRDEIESRWNRANYEPVLLKAKYRGPLANSSLRAIIESRRPRILNDLEDYLAAHPQSHSTKLIVSEGVRSSLTCPLIVLDKPIGFLFFSSRATDTYRDAHSEAYLRIASQVAAAIEKSRLYDHVLELNELKNRFFGMVAHDLRNPLMVIGGFATMLAREKLGPLNPKQAEAIDLIRRNGEAMSKMIEDLLEINIIESGALALKTEAIPLAPFLREKAGEASLLAADKGIRVELDAAADPPEAVFDRRRIAQVIDNLVSNAIKFSHPETTITIATRLENGRLVFRVKDQGQGIPDEELSKLFRRFGRTSVKPTAGEKSVGLGLAIIRKIVEAHNGEIGVESRVGEGSTFWFSLPWEAAP